MRHHYFLFALLFLFACKSEDPNEQSSTFAIDDPARDTLYSDLTQSLLHIERKIIADPANAGLYAERATAYIAHDSVNNAINDLKRAIALDTTEARYHVALGEVYFYKIRVEEARDEFLVAVDLNPDANQARLKLAEIELLLGNFQNTFDMVNEALRRDVYLAQGYYIKGMTYAQMGDTTLAVSSFRTAIEQDPKMYDGYMQLAIIHERLNDPLAEDYYNTAITLRPRSMEAYYGKAMYLQNTGMDSLALSVYDQMKELDPSFATAWYNSGYVYLEYLDEPEKAISQFNQACRLQPMYSKAYFSKGIAHERIGEVEKAGMSLQLALRIEPANTMYAKAMSRLVAAGYEPKQLAK